jgi:hypothetical protein
LSDAGGLASSAAIATLGEAVPWHRRRNKIANVGTVIVILMVTVICIGLLVWAGIILDVRVISPDAGN